MTLDSSVMNVSMAILSFVTLLALFLTRPLPTEPVGSTKGARTSQVERHLEPLFARAPSDHIAGSLTTSCTG
jgi:hypothetical protein